MAPNGTPRRSSDLRGVPLGHGRGGSSVVRGQSHVHGDTNDSLSQVILQLKQLTSKILALGGSEVKDSSTLGPEKSKPENNARSVFRGQASKRLKKEWLIWTLCWCMRIMCYIFSMFVRRHAKTYSWNYQKGINWIYKSQIFQFNASARYICAAHPTAT